MKSKKRVIILITFLIIAIVLVFWCVSPPKFILKHIEKRNFSGPFAQTQWWYFDGMTDKGDVLVLALAPIYWFPDDPSSNDEGVFVFSFSPKGGDVIHQTVRYKTGTIQSTNKSLKIGNVLDIHTDGEDYHISFRTDNLEGNVSLKPRTRPFTALPLGMAPGFMLPGEEKKFTIKTFRYISQVPTGTIGGILNIEGNEYPLTGVGYHEQGFYDGPASSFGSGWVWYHFMSNDWNIFGRPQGIHFVQYKDRILRSSLETDSDHYWIDHEAKEHSRSPHPLTGIMIHFQEKEGVGFEISTIQSEPHRELIYESNKQNSQSWATTARGATLRIEGMGEDQEVRGQLILETFHLK